MTLTELGYLHCTKYYKPEMRGRFIKLFLVIVKQEALGVDYFNVLATEVFPEQKHSNIKPIIFSLS